MVHRRVQSEKAGIEGVIDFRSHSDCAFREPSQSSCLRFLEGYFAKRLKEVKVINPISTEVFLEYNRWLNARLRKKVLI